jgi:GntR family transcriptional regulator, transcriptional repressor for pyruvate dehydrogenase complex
MSFPMPTARPLRKLDAAAQGDASERIALEIRHYLARQKLRPGDRLGTEQELAAEFGVSRPTLREALRLLSSSQLIRATRGPGGGIFVASTPNEGISRSLSDSIATLLMTKTVSLRQLVEARMHLEVPLAGLAAANATPETVLKLATAIAEAEGQAPYSDGFRLADACFHRTIAATAGNELLSAFTSWTLDVLQPSLIAAVGDALDGELILAQHREILRAVGRRQPAAAERAMRRHLEYLVLRVKALEECPDAAAGPTAPESVPTRR